MKKLILTGIAAFCFATMTLAQAPPQGVNYQAVAYDTKSSEIPGTDVSSLPIANKAIKVRFTIIKDQANGNEIYSEEHTTTTDENGLFNLIIGKGFQLSSGDFPSIDWGTGLHFLKVDLDVSGSYNTMGTQQIWSVPYALYSEKSGNGVEQIANTSGDITFTLENGDTYTVPLNGAQGPVGPQGPAGNDGATGPQGPQGPQGVPGTNGVAVNWLGSSATAPPTPALNDGYYNSTDGVSYVWNGTAWQIVAQDGSDGATGPQGPQGPIGNTGPQGIPGTNGVAVNWLGSSATAPPTPALNDGYYNSTDGVSYVWNGSTWNIVAQDGSDGATGPQGPQGPIGNTGPQGIPGTNGVAVNWVGSSATAPPTRALNDGYDNSTDEVSYIWNGTTWNIVAQDGSDGATGPQGPQGPIGNTGPAGPAGPQGSAGANGTNGISINWLGSLGTAPANPTLNQAYYNTTDGISYVWNGASWEIVAQDGTGAGGPHNTLNQAYNEGGAGAGRVITANNGAVEINHTTTGTRGLIVTTNQANSFGIDATNSGTGVAIRARNTNAANNYVALQAETNSSNNINSAILGSNSGAGYAVSGQIPATATGTSAVFGNNLRTTGGSGVRGEGYNGVVGVSSKIDGFGVYGSNTGPYDATDTYPTAGVYGIGITGVYGQTTDVTNGWAGYFTSDIGVEGDAYALGDWFNISDARLKSNIQPIPSALEKIMQLSGNSYTLTTPGRGIDGKISMQEKVQYGVIAQEVQAVFPEMISENAVFRNLGDQTVYKTVNYNELIPVLIEALKELKGEVDANKSEIELLKLEIEALKNK